MKQNWTGENIEIDENTAEEGEVTEETTELVAETIEPIAKNEEGETTEKTTEPVAKNNFSVAVASHLTIKEGRNRHPPLWLADFNSGKGLCEEDEENMTFLMISDHVNFEGGVKSPKWRLAMN